MYGGGYGSSYGGSSMYGGQSSEHIEFQFGLFLLPHVSFCLFSLSAGGYGSSMGGYGSSMGGYGSSYGMGGMSGMGGYSGMGY